MDLHEFQKYLDAALIGKVLLSELGIPHLEAFSGNALYCGRGMPAMNKYKTVKEVCALTGLTRKHLYYFHHEKVVRAVAYANYSVEGYNGYKLYDDLAIEKLQQIALYYQLGLKRDEIRDIMLNPNYDSNAVLRTMLALEQEKQMHIERNIAALEYLILAGTKNGVSGSLRGISLDALGRALLSIRKMSEGSVSSPASQYINAELFTQQFAILITALSQLDDAALKAPAAKDIIQQIFTLSNKHLGADGTPFILGLFMSVLGDGSVAQGIADKLTPSHGRAVIQYIIDHPQLYEQHPHASSGEGTDKNGRNAK